MEHEHTREAIHRRLTAPPEQRYLRDWVYGGIDGTVTTFALVAWVTGAHLAPRIILILGGTNLIADGTDPPYPNRSGGGTGRGLADFARTRGGERFIGQPTGIAGCARCFATSTVCGPRCVHLGGLREQRSPLSWFAVWFR
jgi:VIT family